MIRNIGLIGDFDPEVVAHNAIPKAIQLAARNVGCEAQYEWVATPSLDRNAERTLAKYDALWAVPASPYRSMEGALAGIRYARERGIPFFGTCGGFQHMIIEFARNVLGLADAAHAETDPEASRLLVAPLTCTVSQQIHTFKLKPGTRIAAIYGSHEIEEQYGICNYGLNDEFAPQLEQAGLRIAGTDTEGETRMMELEGHPFYMGALFQPERSALREIVHPLITSFIQAAAGSNHRPE